jgi:hypothetical protein
MEKKNERMDEIEKILNLSGDQIHNAMAIIHDSTHAETQADKPEYACLYDTKMQELCFEYVDQYSQINL